MKLWGRRIKLRPFKYRTADHGRCLWCNKKLTKCQRDDGADFCRPSCAYQFGERIATIGVRLLATGWELE